MMEYFIDEMTAKGKVSHGSAFNAAQASRTAIDIQRRRGNPVTVTPSLVSSNQIESLDTSGEGGEFEILPLTAQELYEEVHGTDAQLSEQSYRTRLIYQLLSETTNQALEDYRSGVIFGGSVEEGVG